MNESLIHLLLLRPVDGPLGVRLGGLCVLPANLVAAVGVCGRGAVLLDRGKDRSGLGLGLNTMNRCRLIARANH